MCRVYKQSYHARSLHDWLLYTEDICIYMSLGGFLHHVGTELCTLFVTSSISNLFHPRKTGLMNVNCLGTDTTKSLVPQPAHPPQNNLSGPRTSTGPLATMGMYLVNMSQTDCSIVDASTCRNFIFIWPYVAQWHSQLSPQGLQAISYHE